MPESSLETAVEPEEARSHAERFTRVVASFDDRLPSELTLGPNPLEIFDLTGVRLFYDFPLIADGALTGHVRAAADRRVGAAVVALERRPRGWDAEETVERALTTTRAQDPTTNVTRESIRIVCYSYPKLAVQVGYTRATGEQATALYDVASGDRVTIAGLTGQSGAHPYLATFTDPEDRIRTYEADAAALTEAALALLPVDGFLPILSFSAQVWLAPECQDVLGVPLLGQITPINCVPASAEMILDHYGWNYPQDQIAQAMGTSVANNGTYYNPGFVQGIATLTKGTMTPAETDAGAPRPTQWNLMTSEIDANRPVFTQMPHHYRVCVGYHQIFFMQFLHIHDPWPPNPNVCQGGADYWENWSGSAVEWFVTLTH